MNPRSRPARRSTRRRPRIRPPTLAGAVAASIVAGALAGALVAAPAPAPAQEAGAAMPDPEVPEGENLQVPEGWRHRLDSPSESAELVPDEEPEGDDVRLVNMRPGWHVTTGPRTILYHPGARASGDFRASVTTHLFPPGERNEAYGIFVGGRDLQGAGQRYLYFLVRRSGEYLVKIRDGDSTRELVGWTAHDAVVPYTDETGETATNALAVEARGDSLHFSVNDTRVTSLARAGLPVEGQVGWRVNHRLDLHISDFSIEELDR